MGRQHVYYQTESDFEQIRQEFIAKFHSLLGALSLAAVLLTRIENVFAITRWRAPFGRYHYVQRYGAVLTKDGNVVTLARGGDLLKIQNVMPWLTDVREVPDMPGEGLGGWAEAVAQVCSDYDVEGVVGVDLMTLGLREELRKRLPSVDFVEVDYDIMVARAVKSPDEIRVIRSACEIAELGLEAGVEMVKPGVKECHISARVAARMLREDIEGLHLTPHVISGEHAGLKYRHHTDRQIRFGDIVRIDCGCVHWGYVGEYNRTVIAGRPSPEQRKLAEVAYESHTQCIQSIKPGIRASEVDAIARAVITEYGYEKYMHRHPTGHGTGLAVHELPSISESSQMILEPGMVINIEPGVMYHSKPEIGGVVFEDVVLVTEDGHELLTRTEYDNRLLGFEACPMGRY